MLKCVGPLISVMDAEDALILCDSFPKLFDLIDESDNEDVDSLKSEQFKPVVDACTLMRYVFYD